MKLNPFNDQRFIAYRSYSADNFERIPQTGRLTARQRNDITLSAEVLPFKTNNYVLNELIDWDAPLNDPLFRLTFPQKEMLPAQTFAQLEQALLQNNTVLLKALAVAARQELVQPLNGPLESFLLQKTGSRSLSLLWHHELPCPTYCAFCYRWPPGASPQVIHPEVPVHLIHQQQFRELVFTGGDPLMAPATPLLQYIGHLLEQDTKPLQRLVFETKSLCNWPYRYTLDTDAPQILAMFRQLVKAGIQPVVLARFHHPAELGTKAVHRAIAAILATGAEIRTETPLLRGINDEASLWSSLWKKQLETGCRPQYMSLPPPTGIYQHFALPLTQALALFREAVQLDPGSAPFAKGPVMATAAGQVQVLDADALQNTMRLGFLTALQTDWENQSFEAQYDPTACWMNALQPAGGNAFFFEPALLQETGKKPGQTAWAFMD